MSLLFRSSVLFAVGILGGILASSAAAVDVRYTITDLGPLTGAWDAVYDISDSGQCAVISKYHNYLYSGSLPMLDLGSSGNGGSIGVNNSGQVTGTYGSHAFLYSGGVMTDLGPPGLNSWGDGINNKGEICGSYHPAAGGEHAFIYSGGVMRDVGCLDGQFCVLLRINDLGQAVGYNSNYGVKYTPAGGLQYLPTLSGVVGNNYETAAYGLNNLGQIVGVSCNASGVARPVLFTGSTVQDLGSLGGRGCAWSINDNGAIVGYSYVDNTRHAFIWQGSSPIVDLNSLIDPASHWTLMEGRAINNGGQIAGMGSYNYSTHGFILTPVPEPASLVFLGMGAAVLLLRRRPRISQGYGEEANFRLGSTGNPR
jgi:probable HAF family extracellular repeat protein